MSTRIGRLLYISLAILLVAACVPTFAQPFPTADPNAIGTFIALTANAAASQTAAAQPTFTLTPTITPTQPTETPSPTPTATVIFVLPTLTQPVFPTYTSVVSIGGGGSGSGGSGTSSANFSCQVLSVSPANGSTFKPRDDFDVIWRVRNNGQKVWDRNSVDFIYDSGAKIHKVAGYDLSANVKPGETINLGADISAPKDSGTYTTTWKLRVGDTEFCKMSFTMVVK